MDAEHAYRKLVQPLFDGESEVRTKDDAVAIQQARVRADKRLDTFLRKSLKGS
jgi:hypothetical protein